MQKSTNHDIIRMYQIGTRNEQNRIITHQKEVGLREQGTPDSIRFSISLIEKNKPQKTNNQKVEVIT